MVLELWPGRGAMKVPSVFVGQWRPGLRGRLGILCLVVIGPPTRPAVAAIACLAPRRPKPVHAVLGAKEYIGFRAREVAEIERARKVSVRGAEAY